MVTDSQEDKVTAQQILHPLSEAPIKFMSRKYEAHPKHLQRLYRPPPPRPQSRSKHTPLPQSNNKMKTRWNPFNEKFYEEELSDEEDEDCNQGPIIGADQLSDNKPEPIIPPPSTEPVAHHHIVLTSTDTSQSLCQTWSQLPTNLNYCTAGPTHHRTLSPTRDPPPVKATQQSLTFHYFFRNTHLVPVL